LRKGHDSKQHSHFYFGTGTTSESFLLWHAALQICSNKHRISTLDDSEPHQSLTTLDDSEPHQSLTTLDDSESHQSLTTLDDSEPHQSLIAGDIIRTRILLKGRVVFA